MGGYLVSAQLRTSGPTSPTASTAITAAGSEAGALNLQQAALALEQFRAERGSYMGAALGGFGVILRRADTSAYCVETGPAPVTHLAGPSGTPATGPC
jgi:hypothetical protein